MVEVINRVMSANKLKAIYSTVILQKIELFLIKIVETIELPPQPNSPSDHLKIILNGVPFSRQGVH